MVSENENVILISIVAVVAVLGIFSIVGFGSLGGDITGDATQVLRGSQNCVLTDSGIEFELRGRSLSRFNSCNDDGNSVIWSCSNNGRVVRQIVPCSEGCNEETAMCLEEENSARTNSPTYAASTSASSSSSGGSGGGSGRVMMESDVEFNYLLVSQYNNANPGDGINTLSNKRLNGENPVYYVEDISNGLGLYIGVNLVSNSDETENDIHVTASIEGELKSSSVTRPVRPEGWTQFQLSIVDEDWDGSETEVVINVYQGDDWILTRTLIVTNQVACTDTDPEENIYVKGVVEHTTAGVFEDECLPNGNLTQYICAAGGVGSSSTGISCPTGYVCSDGACVSNTSLECDSTYADGIFNYTLVPGGYEVFDISDYDNNPTEKQVKFRNVDNKLVSMPILSPLEGPNLGKVLWAYDIDSPDEFIYFEGERCNGFSSASDCDGMRFIYIGEDGDVHLIEIEEIDVFDNKIDLNDRTYSINIDPIRYEDDIPLDITLPGISGVITLLVSEESNSVAIVDAGADKDSDGNFNFLTYDGVRVSIKDTNTNTREVSTILIDSSEISSAARLVVNDGEDTSTILNVVRAEANIIGNPLLNKIEYNVVYCTE